MPIQTDTLDVPRTPAGLQPWLRASSCLTVGIFATLGLAADAEAAPGDTDDRTRTTSEHDHDDDADHDHDDGDIDGAEDTHLRLHVDSEALGGAWTNAEGDPDGDGVDSDDSFSFGAGLSRSSLLDSGPAVFSRPLIGFGLGYVFAQDRAIVGAKLGLSVDGFGIESSGRTVAVGGRLVPYFQWMFRPERWVRPYVEARLGLGGSAASREIDGIGRTTGHVLYPMAGAGAGVHLFPRDWFSIDLGLNVDYAAPYTRTTFEDDERADTDFTKSADVVNFGVLLGMSVWFGDYGKGQRRR